MKKASGKKSGKDEKSSGKKGKKKGKGKVNEVEAEITELSSSEDEYESSEEAQGKAKGKTKRIRVSHRGSFVRVSKITEDTPRIRGRGMASKGARKGKKIKILPDSGATMTLCHAKVAKRLGLTISRMDRDIYELVDAQGRQLRQIREGLITF